MVKLRMAWLLSALLAFSFGAHADKGPEKININKASVQELDDGLRGVGERIAKEIVRHREDHGPYKSFEDLDEVKFVGSSLIKKNRKRITFE